MNLETKRTQRSLLTCLRTSKSLSVLSPKTGTREPIPKVIVKVAPNVAHPTAWNLSCCPYDQQSFHRTPGKLGQEAL